jgi:hypothetical protein
VNPAYEAYDRALAKVAKTRLAYENALTALEEAQAPIEAEVRQVWEANHQAVVDAAALIETAVQNVARVQVETATAARARARGKAPVLDDDELALVAAAEAEVAAAQEAHNQAKEQFKQGVTAEQLDALGG